MALSDELEPILEAAAAVASSGERLTGVLIAEPLAFGRVYLCAFESDSAHAWLALDAAAVPVTSREAVREAAQLAALCEVAVLERAVERHGVGKADAGPGRRQFGKSRAAAGRHGERTPAEPRLLVPWAGSGGMPAT